MALAAIVVATILNRVWEGIHGAGYHLGVKPLPDSLLAIPRGSKRIVPEVIGNFGVLDTRLPTLAWLTGYLLIGVLLMLALRLGSTRERRVVVGATVVAVLLPGVEQWLLYRHTGFWIQGRYFLPILLAAPLLYGEVVLRRSDSLPSAVAAAAPATLHGHRGSPATGGLVGELAPLRGGHRRAGLVLRAGRVEPAGRLDGVGRDGHRRRCGGGPGGGGQECRRSERNRRRPARTGRLGCSESTMRETKRAAGLIPTPGEGREWR